MANDEDHSLADITDALLTLEAKSGFFEIEINGIPVWERIRFHVHRELLKALGVAGQAHSSAEFESIFERYWIPLRSLCESAGRRNPLLAPEHDVLVWGHSRRNMLDDGLWWDLYFDPIYDHLDLDYLHLESQHLRSHRRPAKTENLRYLDFIEYTAKLSREIGLGSNPPSDDELEELRRIRDEIHEEFGVDINFEEQVTATLALRQPLLVLYRRLLRRVDPDIVLLVVSYGRETFIEACQELSIPVVELQHGVIHPFHLGYRYPGDRTKEAFPDYLFTFGEFWNDVVEYPIPEERVIGVGYPYLEQQREKYKEIPRKDQILFISQGPIGEQLSKFALEVDEDPRIDYSVIYKLHPGEYDRWRDEYPWLREVNFEVIDDPEVPLYRLFAESKVQIGVGSTAVYEGLSFDLETYVFDCPGSEVLEYLVEHGVAESVNSTEDLSSKLNNHRIPFDKREFFKRESIDQISKEIREIKNS